jgi:hypothetical protein
MHVDHGCPALDVFDRCSLAEVKPALLELHARDIGVDLACKPIMLRLRHAIRSSVA